MVLILTLFIEEVSSGLNHTSTGDWTTEDLETVEYSTESPYLLGTTRRTTKRIIATRYSRTKTYTTTKTTREHKTSRTTTKTTKQHKTSRTTRKTTRESKTSTKKKPITVPSSTPNTAIVKTLKTFVTVIIQKVSTPAPSPRKRRSTKSAEDMTLGPLMLQQLNELRDRSRIAFENSRRKRRDYKEHDIRYLWILFTLPIIALFAYILSVIIRRKKYHAKMGSSRTQPAFKSEVKVITSEELRRKNWTYIKTPLTPVRDQFDAKKFTDRGPLVLTKELQGDVKFADVTSSKEITKVEFDEGLNEIVGIGSCVEVITESERKPSIIGVQPTAQTNSEIDKPATKPASQKAKMKEVGDLELTQDKSVKSMKNKQKTGSDSQADRKNSRRAIARTMGTPSSRKENRKNV
ncbi:hypothetical protein RB195_012762 [Necator americanus]|uniref:Uncharacterized protein n=1 Tax=Necator americanus TaxID=51031 RepID=A0ABR1DSI0_NECAM